MCSAQMDMVFQSDSVKSSGDLPKPFMCKIPAAVSLIQLTIIATSNSLNKIPWLSVRK